MRIAILLNSFPEISEKFLLNQIVGYVQAGMDITVFAAHRSERTIHHDMYEKYSIADRVKYIDIPRSIKKRFIAFPRLFVKLFLKNPVVAFRALQFHKYKTVCKNIKLIYFGNCFANETPFDIVHCHFGVNGLIGAYIKNSGFARHLVTTFHGSDINTYPSRFGLDVYKTLYQCADYITANTEFTKKKIIANGCPEKKIRVIPVGLVKEEYEGICEGSKKIRDPHMILTVGRLEEKKGHQYALYALAECVKTNPHIRYHIAGDGSLKKELMLLGKTLNLSDHLVFYGAATSETVCALYGKASVFVLPSVTAKDGDMEGQALVLQEAQICGIPVVSTLHNGIPDGVLDGVSGYLVPEKDVKALSKSILVLLNNPEKALEMGEKGKAFVENRYDIKIITKAFASLYDEIIATSAATNL